MGHWFWSGVGTRSDQGFSSSYNDMQQHFKYYTNITKLNNDGCIKIPNFGTLEHRCSFYPSRKKISEQR